MDETYTNLIKSIVSSNMYYISQLELSKVEGENKHHAIRLITNCIDVLNDQSIKEIDLEIINMSKQLVKTHLIYNKTLTPEQRSKFENIIF